MKRLFRAAGFVFALLAVTLATLPFRSFDIIASDTDLYNVSVTDNGNTEQYRTGAKTVGAFFDEHNIRLYAKDVCAYDLEDAITDGMEIRIERGLNIVVDIDGVKEKRRVAPGTTVERLMIALQDEWSIALLFNGDMQRTVRNDETLVFSSWYSELITVTDDVPYESFSIETTAALQGVTRVRQEGETGESQRTIAVIYIGGVEHKRETLEELLLLEPVPEIIDIGIGGTLGTTTDITSPSFQYVKKLTMNASAYTAGFESTGKNPGDPGYGITRSGEQVRRGIVSVDPNVIPLGTRLYVDGYGYSLAADTGSGIVGYMIDLFYESLDDALRFGRKNIDVYVLD